MKKKQLKSKDKSAPLASPFAELGAKNVKTESTSEPSRLVVTESEFPPPHFLEQEAMQESNRKVIQDYSGTIHILRDQKGFSFREIAEWLTARGIDADYNAVYREYTRDMSEQEERDTALVESYEHRET